MDTNVRLSGAQIIGRSHLLSGKNSQDALVTGYLEIDEDVVYYGLICDGCSEGKNSEVGAKLASSYIARQIEILAKSKVDVKRIPWVLHKRTLEFLKQLLGKISFDSPVSRVTYIKDNLLFTVLGFIYTSHEVVFFAQGDGVIVVNDEVFVRDEQDLPKYIGYNLVERKFLASGASEMPESFDITIFPTGDIERLSIASDSLGHESDLIPQIWQDALLDGGKKLSLQKKVNVWSLVQHKFSDDLTIVTLEKIQGG